MNREPFTPEEKEVMDLLIEAHNKYMQLPDGHPSERQEWVMFIHHLQDILGHRVLRRDYPDYFR